MADTAEGIGPIIMKRQRGRPVLIVLLALVLMVPATEAFSQSASDPVRPPPQERSGFHPLKPILRLFGLEQRRRPPPVQRLQQVQPPRQRTTTVREPTRPAIVEEPKEPDARVVLVLGDEFAEGLAEGLQAAYAETPSVKVERLIRSKNGLADPPEPTWADLAQGSLQGGNVALVVVMLGSHDVGDIETANGTLAFGTPEWETAYERRLDTLAKTVRLQKKPLIWVGLPPAKDTAKRSAFSYLNQLAKARVEASLGYFVDIWDVFLDEDGQYTAQGPDVDGKVRRLRANDGVGFTWSGYRKVAFFCEREIARVIGSSGAFAFDGVDDDPNFVVLTGRTTSPEIELAGGDGAPPDPIADTVQHRLIVEGKALERVFGRIDDFRID